MASKLTTLAQQKSAAQIQSMSRESYNWLLQKIAQLRNPASLAQGIKSEDNRIVKRLLKGCLYFFYYDPKLKADLPYYDRFPLVLVLERYPDGFLGLNLHYLPLKYRVAFLDKLLDYAVWNENDDPQRVRITYDILNASKRFRSFKPCIKRYLTQHVKSKILAVQPNEWEVATFLPVHQFKGAKPEQIWKESVQEIRNN
jgi:hypothetical protein